MGYACPVCATPQRDAEHLANHLAFTAMLRGGDHEAWLDDNVSEWEESTPRDLASAVADLADATDYDEVFDDTAPDERDDDAHDHRPPTDGAFVPTSESLDAETQQVLDEARDLTRRMRGDDESESASDGNT